MVEPSAEPSVAKAMSANARQEIISELHSAMYLSMIDA